MDRTRYARIAGTALLIAVVSVLVLHIGPMAIGGTRASGTSDVARVTAFYSHPSMVPFWWSGGVAIVAIAVFAMSFRRYLGTFELSPLLRITADAGAAITVGALPLYAIGSGLESAMVQLVAAGDAGKPALLGVFVAWDWIYNSVAYWFEAGYMAAWAVVAWKSGALPRWIAAIGGLTALGHLFNSQVLVSGLSDDLTLIPTAMFVAWFITAGVHLFRVAGSARPVAAAT
ncbi:MAG: hypothetical protein ABIV26_04770 [Candidatus Limnocylindrales bacterium]